MFTRGSLLTGIAALALLHASSAFAETIVHQINVPFMTAIMNPCTVETVAVEGSVDLIVHMIESSSGALHYKLHQASKGKGVGVLSGDRYVYSEEMDSELTASGAITQSQTLNHVFTSASPTDNFFMKMTFHSTLNGRGVPTAYVDKFEIGCRG